MVTRFNQINGIAPYNGIVAGQSVKVKELFLAADDPEDARSQPELSRGHLL